MVGCVGENLPFSVNIRVRQKCDVRQTLLVLGENFLELGCPSDCRGIFNVRTNEKTVQRCKYLCIPLDESPIKIKRRVRRGILGHTFILAKKIIFLEISRHGFVVRRIAILLIPVAWPNSIKLYKLYQLAQKTNFRDFEKSRGIVGHLLNRIKNESYRRKTRIYYCKRNNNNS